MLLSCVFCVGDVLQEVYIKRKLRLLFTYRGIFCVYGYSISSYVFEDVSLVIILAPSFFIREIILGRVLLRKIYSPLKLFKVLRVCIKKEALVYL